MRLRFLLALSAVGTLIASVQFVALLHAPLNVTPDRFKNACFLRSSSAWHYGYLLGQHGARLVRTADVGHTPPSSPVHYADLHRVMATALTALPRKAALEGLHYFVVLSLVLGGAVGLFRVSQSTRLRRRYLILGCGVGAVGLLFLFLAPFLVIGYGSSAFSTWTGPGAYSSSGSYLWLFTVPGETVSYRYAVEVVLYSSLWATDQIDGLAYAVGHSMPVRTLLAFLPDSLNPPSLPWRLLFYGSATLQAFIIGTAAACLTSRRWRA